MPKTGSFRNNNKTLDKAKAFVESSPKCIVLISSADELYTIGHRCSGMFSVLVPRLIWLLLCRSDRLEHEKVFVSYVAVEEPTEPERGDHYQTTDRRISRIGRLFVPISRRTRATTPASQLGRRLCHKLTAICKTNASEILLTRWGEPV